jgi:hypothetical protein
MPVGGAHMLFSVIPRGDEPNRRRHGSKKSSSSPCATLPPTSLVKIDRTVRGIFAGALIRSPFDGPTGTALSCAG